MLMPYSIFRRLLQVFSEIPDSQKFPGWFLCRVTLFRNRFMAESSGNNTGKKLIRIDVSSDTICPWGFVGKRNLDKAIALSRDQYDFEIIWHPYFLFNPSVPRRAISKEEYFQNKFGMQSEFVIAEMAEVFRGIGLEYDTSGLTGKTMDSHRLMYFAGQQGIDKQHSLVEELFLGYFTQGKYIGDRNFLVGCARKVGVEGAAEFLKKKNNGLKEVKQEFKKHRVGITALPYYMINGKLKVSGGQPPHVFLKAFQTAASSSD